MSLATRCPACGTIFRVVQDQLKVSEGWVRCGQCHEVFHGIEALVRPRQRSRGRRAPRRARRGARRRPRARSPTSARARPSRRASRPTRRRRRPISHRDSRAAVEEQPAPPVTWPHAPARRLCLRMAPPHPMPGFIRLSVAADPRVPAPPAPHRGIGEATSGLMVRPVGEPGLGFGVHGVGGVRGRRVGGVDRVGRAAAVGRVHAVRAGVHARHDRAALRRTAGRGGRARAAGDVDPMPGRRWPEPVPPPIAGDAVRAGRRGSTCAADGARHRAVRKPCPAAPPERHPRRRSRRLPREHRRCRPRSAARHSPMQAPVGARRAAPGGLAQAKHGRPRRSRAGARRSLPDQAPAIARRPGRAASRATSLPLPVARRAAAPDIVVSTMRQPASRRRRRRSRPGRRRWRRCCRRRSATGRRTGPSRRPPTPATATAALVDARPRIRASCAKPAAARAGVGPACGRRSASPCCC